MAPLRTGHARLLCSSLILLVGAVGCVDDLEPAGYPGAACNEPGRIEDVAIERIVAENYIDAHGHRVVEGDIVVSGSNATAGLDKSSVSVSARSWPFGIVPYTVDRTVPWPARHSLELAIAEFEQHTNIRFITRSAANEALYPNYVRVVVVESKIFAGRSPVAMVGGEQVLELVEDADIHTALHELGHAVGLLHEQQRHDRDQYVTIHEANVMPENLDSYRNIDPDGMDVGDYDFASIMHYRPYDAEGQWAIEPKDKFGSWCSVGADVRLSSGDRAAILLLYPNLNLGKHGDLNGDGTRDQVLRDQDGASIKRSIGDGYETYWKKVSPSGTLDWYLTGTGDFGGDGIDDLLWTLPDGDVRVFDMGKGALDGDAFVSSTHTPKRGWQVVAIDDFDGNGKHELLTMNQWGAAAVVFPETSQELELQPVPFAWRLAATGDLDGDAKADIVWSTTNAQTAVWFMSGAELRSATEPVSHEAGWWIAGIDDFDGDGRNDIVWTSVLGGVAMWWNDGGPIGMTETRRRRGPSSFVFAGTGDFDGDGVADLRWSNDQGSIALELFSPIRSSLPRILNVPEAHFSASHLLN